MSNISLNHRLEPRWAPIVIRLATAGDGRALERLAQLDSASAPAGQTVIAELDGRPVVAISLADGSTIADPFVPTSEISELVRLRADQLGLFARSGEAQGSRRVGKASPDASKASARQIGSVLPMYRRLSQLILRTA
jgi:hypothetical protein